ncbi:segregation and condensation protein A [Endozoicomonas sp. (ex Bugula neritina AB1)]|nr:segregation and condensation protein A [Endozoicomonas sp. (ex Bugula neritina AB1)]
MTTTEAVAELTEAPKAATPETAEHALQQDMFALIKGEPLTKLPDDLYIPPDALEIFLEAFEGPLDLLLYLIKRNNMEILDIKVAEITRQYMDYVELMQSSQFELAAEYLVMAATLAEIKSRMLLPRVSDIEGEEEDPRAELIRRLQEYERFKKAAEDIDQIPRLGRDTHIISANAPEYQKEQPHPDVDLKDILLAMGEVIRRADMFEHHHVEEEALSVRERMSEVLSMLSAERFTPFVALYRVDEGRLGVVVTFMAIMELIKESLIELVQSEPYGPIHVKARIE